MVKIRVGNTQKQPVRVVLEPWAWEWTVIPDDCLVFVWVSDDLDNRDLERGWFVVEASHYGLIVYPEGEITQVDVYDSKGSLVSY